MKKAVLKAEPNNAIVTHVWNTGHKIQWNESACVDWDVDWYRRRVKEALHIKNTSNAMNSDPLFVAESLLGCLKVAPLPSPPPPTIVTGTDGVMTTISIY